MLENETEEPRIKLELSDESKELLIRLRTQQKIEEAARNASERGVLAQARLQSEADATSLVTALLAMNVEAERQLYAARRERDTFSGQVDHLMRQVGTCHATIDELKNDADKSTTQKRELSEFLKNAMDENRALKASNRTVCVRDMFVRVLPHQERNDKPTVPSEAAIRLQTRIDAEEFVEKIEALYDDPSAINQLKVLLLQWIVGHSPIRKDLHDRLPEFADALADNAVTNEGFAVLFGIDLESVFQEVHASNMRKGDGPIVNGKRSKPEGWAPPDVVGVLRKQGWSPSIEAELDKPIQYAIGPKAMEDPSTYATCTVHQIAFDEAFGCARCENAQYNGSEIDPVGELAREASVEVVALSGSVEEDGETIRVKFRTEDRALTERLQMIARERRTVVPEIQGKAYPRSKIPDIRVDHPTWGDPYFDVSIVFRKVD